MTSYLLLKALHVGCAVASIAGFIARGLGVLCDAEWVSAPWVRVVPHVVDTVLLGSALGLAMVLAVSPFHDAWLAAKIGALIAYIVLGSVALRRGRTKRQRAIAFAAALCVITYILAVAVTRSPRPWA